MADTPYLDMNKQQGEDRQSIVELGEVGASSVGQSEYLNNHTSNNEPNLLLGKHGLFLGRWKPATEFKLPCCFRCCCCCCIYCCCPSMKKPRVTSIEGVWYLAMIQVIVGILNLTYSLFLLAMGSSKRFDVTDYMVDVALGYWAMHGAQSFNSVPVDKFSFAQFILALKAALLIPIAILFYSCGGARTSTEVIAAIVNVVYYIYSAAYKLYYSYVAWSCCYEILSAQAGKDTAQYSHSDVDDSIAGKLEDWLFGRKTDGI